MAVWRKVPDGIALWAPGVSAKTAYRAAREGDLKVARIASGRNYLICEAFVTEWLLKAAGMTSSEIQRFTTAEKANSVSHETDIKDHAQRCA